MFGFGFGYGIQINHAGFNSIGSIVAEHTDVRGGSR